MPRGAAEWRARPARCPAMDRLVPGLDRPRPRRAPRALIAVAATAPVATAALMVAYAATVHRAGDHCLSVAPAPAPAPPPAPALTTAPADAPEIDAPPPVIAAGTCGSIIAPLRQPTSAADADALRALVGSWLADGGTRGPGIAHRRGVLHVESAEDRGDEPPYPRSAEPEAARVCGSPAVWLRTYLREVLTWQGGELACDGNICCYGGMEYAPRGYVAFHHGPGDDAPWTLDAWIEVYDAGLGPAYADANIRFVERALRRLVHGHCAGEPAGRVD